MRMTSDLFGAHWRPPVVSFPQTASSDCVLWTDTRHRNSSGRRQNLEATAPRTQSSSTNFTYVREQSYKYQPDYSGFTGCLSLCSMLLTWRRSRMSLKTASCWEPSSNMEMSSRCVHHEFLFYWMMPRVHPTAGIVHSWLHFKHHISLCRIKVRLRPQKCTAGVFPVQLVLNYFWQAWEELPEWDFWKRSWELGD